MNALLYLLIGTYLALFIFAEFFSGRVIFQPHPPGYRDTPEILKLTTRDGTRISAMYLSNSQARYTLLFSHGNAEDLGDDLPLLRQLREAGFSVFAYDYHGYGTSQGRPSEDAVYQDVDAAYDYLTGELGFRPDHIVSHGRSLGGAVAIDLAARRPVAGLIVESSFVSAFRVLTRVPLLPFDKFRSLPKLHRVRCPVLVMHGKSDTVIPFANGPKLYDAAPQPKRFLWVEGAGHNDLADVAGPRYFQALREFAALLQESR